MAEEQKILSIIDYINQNNICNKYLNKLKNIIGSSNVEILSRVKEKQSALDKMKVRHFVSANQISDFVGYMIITDTVEDVYKIKNKIENDLGNCLEEDYIKNPKNGYKSIHLNYLVEKDIPLEIQIKTKQIKQFGWQRVSCTTQHQRHSQQSVTAENTAEVVWGVRDFLAFCV